MLNGKDLDAIGASEVRRLVAVTVASARSLDLSDTAAEAGCDEVTAVVLTERTEAAEAVDVEAPSKGDVW